MNTPRLLRYKTDTVLPNAVFSDLQMTPLLDEQTVSVLGRPCGAGEIKHRQEVFRLLALPQTYEKVQVLLSSLKAEERMLSLIKEAPNSVERVYLYGKLFSAHIVGWERLVSMVDCGVLFRDTAEYFSSSEMEQTITEMKKDAGRLASLLETMKKGLLSFSEKNWITPDCDSETEYDTIAACVRSLGFEVTGQRIKNTRVDLTLADAICRLFEEEMGEAEAIMGKYDSGLFSESVSYIEEIRFFLAVHAFLEKAKSYGIPHCFPKIAENPRYTAKNLYDASLMTKECRSIVPNDADFTGNAPFYFLVGANGGGKTTYLRSVGFNLVLFLAGCPVFAEEASIYPFDFAASHFPMDERFDNTGRLDEERKRVNEILTLADGKKSFLLFNETYSGTDDKRGFRLLLDSAEQIKNSGHFGLFVTHFHEIEETEYPILSAVVDASDENRRTYRVVKAKGNASSYAADILRKYGLDRESLRKRRDEHDHSFAESE